MMNWSRDEWEADCVVAGFERDGERAVCGGDERGCLLRQRRRLGQPLQVSVMLLLGVVVSQLARLRIVLTPNGAMTVRKEKPEAQVMALWRVCRKIVPGLRSG